MIPVSVGELAAWTGGRLHSVPPEVVVTGEVQVDSRLVGPGALFVALRGERTDGHDHARAAVSAGAVAVLAEREIGAPCVVVPDALAAMQTVAREVFARCRPHTVGITGSSGKTSTKDLMAHVLAAYGPTLAPAGSYNNEVGLPLTVLRLTAETGFAVLEYSARGPGHIAFLCEIARPDVAVVLNVGTAHLGEFGSVEAIARAKSELVESLAGERSTAVLHADDPLVLRMRANVPAGSDIVTFGRSATADYRAEQVTVATSGRAAFRLCTPYGTADVALQLVGEHHVANALAVAAAVLSGERTRSAGATVEGVAARLGDAVRVSRWRMEVTERPDGVTVVNDAYNANPDSMRAALKTLAVMSDGKSRRTIAVLGVMNELGEAARAEHMDLGRFVVRLDIGQLVVVGEQAGGIHAGAVLEGSWGSESIHVADPDEAVALLRKELRPGDVVLVKASRSAGLERVAAALLDAGAGATA